MFQPDFPLSATAAAVAIVAATSAAWLVPTALQRIQLSRAKHPSLIGHVRLAKRLSRWVPGYQYDDAGILASDGAPAQVVAQRKAGMATLADSFALRFARTNAATAQARKALPDLQFTGVYRVPFPCSTQLRQHLSVGAFLQCSDAGQKAALPGMDPAATRYRAHCHRRSAGLVGVAGSTVAGSARMLGLPDPFPSL